MFGDLKYLCLFREKVEKKRKREIRKLREQLAEQAQRATGGISSSYDRPDDEAGQTGKHLLNHI